MPKKVKMAKVVRVAIREAQLYEGATCCSRQSGCILRFEDGKQTAEVRIVRAHQSWYDKDFIGVGHPQRCRRRKTGMRVICPGMVGMRLSLRTRLRGKIQSSEGMGANDDTAKTKNVVLVDTTRLL